MAEEQVESVMEAPDLSVAHDGATESEPPVLEEKVISPEEQGKIDDRIKYLADNNAKVTITVTTRDGKSQGRLEINNACGYFSPAKNASDEILYNVAGALTEFGQFEKG